MNKKLLFALLFISSKAVVADYWTQKANVPTGPRLNAIGFALNGFGYYGTGNYQSFSYNDFYMYNPQLNTWTQKSDIGWYWKQDCVGFSVAGKGYVANGWNMSNNVDLTEVWEYDDVSNAWTQKANYPGIAMLQCFSFVVGNKAYVGGGNNGINYYNHLYEYDPAANIWTQKANFPGNARDYITTFTIGNYGYVGNGKDGSGTTYANYYKYDPSVNTWYPVASCPLSRVAGTGFSINGMGYAGMGGISVKTTFHSYNPTTDSWTQKAYFSGYGGQHSVSFVLNNKGYVADLQYSVNNTELWEYTPDPTGVDDAGDNALPQMSVYPSPAHDFITASVNQVELLHSLRLEITDVKGNLILRVQQPVTENKISISSLAKGIYFLNAVNGNKATAVKFVKN